MQRKVSIVAEAAQSPLHVEDAVCPGGDPLLGPRVVYGRIEVEFVSGAKVERGLYTG